MALVVSSVAFNKFIDYNSFSYTVYAASLNDNMQAVPIYVNGSGPYDSDATLVCNPSKNTEYIEVVITNDIDDRVVKKLKNPFYGTFTEPQVA